MYSVMKELMGAMNPRIFGLEPPLGTSLTWSLTWINSRKIGRLNKNQVCVQVTIPVLGTRNEFLPLSHVDVHVK